MLRGGSYGKRGKFSTFSKVAGVLPALLVLLGLAVAVPASGCRRCTTASLLLVDEVRIGSAQVPGSRP